MPSEPVHSASFSRGLIPERWCKSGTAPPHQRPVLNRSRRGCKVLPPAAGRSTIGRDGGPYAPVQMGLCADRGRGTVRHDTSGGVCRAARTGSLGATRRRPLLPRVHGAPGQEGPVQASLPGHRYAAFFFLVSVDRSAARAETRMRHAVDPGERARGSEDPRRSPEDLHEIHDAWHPAARVLAAVILAGAPGYVTPTVQAPVRPSAKRRPRARPEGGATRPRRAA